ncbi:zinc finger BED domain-containing protein RICESLEEPER 2-like [Brachypodium distachyon]|uniref:zinc finger BED domain-containing protein RICESLEEPER 2-like n=1 Tax=Brachypodium distachyon TaxID=15368 RepID=UPI000D0D88B9|nr:zinc finger BED domain-containing protein RICESLEEPER 2-like [Brachypodium distachyon]|eukprot:XP_024313494.1 zinc finger BED domain-containing protein RICESLEEPER 2-like [Brachypodium distachyon]
MDEQNKEYEPAEENISMDEDEDLSDDVMSDDDPLFGFSRGTDEVDQETVAVDSDEGHVSGEKSKKGVKVGGVKIKSKHRENAPCWRVFKKQPLEEGGSLEGDLKAICKYCDKEYKYTQGSSTSSMNRHMKNYQKLKSHAARFQIQTRLGYKPAKASSASDESVLLAPGYDHATMKELIAKMIDVHEYSFRMVEHEWFNAIMRYLNPLYQFIGRKAIRAECLRVYKKEKEILKSSLKNVKYIGLTTDMWTSNHTISYMCVVAHYIDKNWKMQTRVLAFVELDTPHTGHVIADALWSCVIEWKIEDKVVSITLDNASNNDVAVRDLKAKFAFRRGVNFEANYFHVRCCAHIVNLVVKDGAACLEDLISNLRETVKYFKKSPARLHKFVEICRDLRIDVGEHLHLDVCTRWGSTYRMIKTGVPYKQALATYAISDASYKWEPSRNEWAMFEQIEPLLFAFARVTTAFSGQYYPTANIFYPHVVSMKIALIKVKESTDETFGAMGIAMMEKFDNYWEEPNNLMVIAPFLTQGTR